ncbi:MAG: DinB family protein [Gemmatimonadaceae bacterium]
MRMLPAAVFATLALLVLPPVASAQRPGRLALIDDWKHQQKYILAVIDSASPEMLDFRPTKGVRTFAEQIYHIASVASRLVSDGVTGKPLPPDLLGDSAVYLHDRAQLRAMAERHLTWILSVLSSLSDEDLLPERTFAGGAMPRWRWNMTALQHSGWTLGQLVPYLRLNGRTPPQFTPF